MEFKNLTKKFSFTVFLEVASDNVAALALYAKAGFRTAGTRSGYYSDGRDALIQWCRIPSAPSPTSAA